MKIHEYQAKAILKDYGILVPRGEVITDPAHAEWAAIQVGLPAVVKAQIHAGGRGKAGGIKPVNDRQEARQIVEGILNKKLKTHQTGDEGLLVQKVLIEKQLAIQREFYLGITVNRAKACPVIIASSSGGMEIEEIARTSPEKILEEEINPLLGLQDFQMRKLAYGLRIGPELIPQMIEVISKLYRIFTEKDCMLAEINPLVLTGGQTDNQNKFVALDAKMVFDDYALFRHPEIAELADFSMMDELEAKAAKAKVNYVRLKGNIGLIINGAGLAMSTMDIMKKMGAEPANFFDVGGSARAEEIEMAFQLLLADPNVKVILINIFGSLVRPEYLVAGITRAIAKEKTSVPLVIRLMGEHGSEGVEKLRESGLEFIAVENVEDGVQKAMELLKGGAK